MSAIRAVIAAEAAIVELVAELRHRRLELRLTQRFVAAAIGVSVESLSAWERGVKIPLATHLAAWAVALGVRLALAGDER